MPHANNVETKHEAKKDLLGAFPKPTLRTITAAETLKTLLGETGYKGTMAVSVTEFRGYLKQRDVFIVAFSGYHPTFKINRLAANARLTEALRALDPRSGEASYWFADLLDKVYHPMHQTTVGFFQTAFGRAFGADTHVNRAAIDQAMVNFAAIFSDPDCYMKEKPNQKAATRKGAICGVLGSALAVRMDLVQPGDVARAVRTLRAAVADVRSGFPFRADSKWLQFFTFVESMLDASKVEIPGKAAGDDFTSKAPTTGDKTIDGACKEAVQAWGANALGRYCAEPKAYACVRELEIGLIHGEQLGRVLGQLAFWYSNPDVDPPRTFSAPLLIIGPEAVPEQPMHGGYMAPCTSCRNRSAQMLIGL
jgi:hypothetical protein